MFHSISPPGQYFENAVSTETFIRQLSYLSKHYSILRLTQEGQFTGYDSTKVNVLLTFDDGFIDNYAVAAPILFQFKMTAVFFVIAECLPDGRSPSFISATGRRSNLDAYRTFATPQAQELLAMGMTIGSHGKCHSDYNKISAEAGLEDALQSKAIIENEIAARIESFAFPWGRYQKRHIKTLTHAYRRIFTAEHGFNAIEDFVFYRNEVASFPHLRCAASGALDFFSALTGWRVEKLFDGSQDVQ